MGVSASQRRGEHDAAAAAAATTATTDADGDVDVAVDPFVLSLLCSHSTSVCKHMKALLDNPTAYRAVLRHIAESYAPPAAREPTAAAATAAAAKPRRRLLSRRLRRHKPAISPAKADPAPSPSQEEEEEQQQQHPEDGDSKAVALQQQQQPQRQRRRRRQNSQQNALGPPALPQPLSPALPLDRVRSRAFSMSESMLVCKKSMSNLLALGEDDYRARVLVALHVTQQPDADIDQFAALCSVDAIAAAIDLLEAPRRIEHLQAQIEQVLGGGDDDDGGGEGGEQAGAAEPEVVQGAPRARVDAWATEVRLLQKRLGYANAADALDDDDVEMVLVHGLIESAAFSQSFAEFVRRWVRAYPGEAMLMKMLLPQSSATIAKMRSWKSLVKMVQFEPKDFAVPYFLEFVRVGRVPDGSLPSLLLALVRNAEQRPAASTASAIARRLKALGKKHPQLYALFDFVHTQTVLRSSPRVLKLFAKKMPLVDAVVHLETLCGADDADAADLRDVIVARLQQQQQQQQNTAELAVLPLTILLQRLVRLRAQRGHQQLADLLVPATFRKVVALQTRFRVRSQRVAVLVRDAPLHEDEMVMRIALNAVLGLVEGAANRSAFVQLLQRLEQRDSADEEEEEEQQQQGEGRVVTALAAAVHELRERQHLVDVLVLVLGEALDAQQQSDLVDALVAYSDALHADVGVVFVCLTNDTFDTLQQQLRRRRSRMQLLVVELLTPLLLRPLSCELRHQFKAMDAMLGQVIMFVNTCIALPPAS